MVVFLWIDMVVVQQEVCVSNNLNRIRVVLSWEGWLMCCTQTSWTRAPKAKSDTERNVNEGWSHVWSSLHLEACQTLLAGGKTRVHFATSSSSPFVACCRNVVFEVAVQCASEIEVACLHPVSLGSQLSHYHLDKTKATHCALFGNAENYHLPSKHQKGGSS